jgi:outer membrane protein OmpA-like peptidoglycan-associated protein
MTIDLEGTTDPVGRLDYNLRLSQRRVETVRRWLVAKGVDRSRIVGSRGRGPLVNVSVKNDVKRRVIVKLMTSAERGQEKPQSRRVPGSPPRYRRNRPSSTRCFSTTARARVGGGSGGDGTC